MKPSKHHINPDFSLSAFGWIWPVWLILLITPSVFLFLWLHNSYSQAQAGAQYRKLPAPAGCVVSSTQTQASGFNSGFEKTTHFNCDRSPDARLRQAVAQSAENAGYRIIPNSGELQAGNSRIELTLQSSCCQAVYQFDQDGIILVFHNPAP